MSPAEGRSVVDLGPAIRRILAGLAVALVAFGVGMLVYPATTDFYARQAQSRLRREFARSATAQPGPAPATGIVAPAPARPPGPGRVAGLIRIPKLGLDAVIVEGTDPRTLRGGPGHYSQTPPPCSRGNVAIAGHRTTYGRPFSHLGQLVPGDTITLVTPLRRCTYDVVAAPPRRAGPRAGPRAGRAFWITTPGDWSVIGPLQGSFLTLTTCNPAGSASQRLIVRARLRP